MGGRQAKAGPERELPPNSRPGRQPGLLRARPSTTEAMSVPARPTLKLRHLRGGPSRSECRRGRLVLPPGPLLAGNRASCAHAIPIHVAHRRDASHRSEGLACSPLISHSEFASAPLTPHVTCSPLHKTREQPSRRPSIGHKGGRPRWLGPVGVMRLILNELSHSSAFGRSPSQRDPSPGACTGPPAAGRSTVSAYVTHCLGRGVPGGPAARICGRSLGLAKQFFRMTLATRPPAMGARWVRPLQP